MKITCPNCETKFAIGLDQMGAKGKKLKCSSCEHVWRQFDPKPDAETPPNASAKAAKKTNVAEKPKQAKTAEPAAEKNDQSAVDDMFASPEPEPSADEENDQSAIDDMFATPEPEPSADEENDQNAIDDMFATPEPSGDEGEENDQNAIDDMFAVAEPSDDDGEENDQNAIDDMFDAPNSIASVDDQSAEAKEPVAESKEQKLNTAPQQTNEAEFERALPSQSAVYRKNTPRRKKPTLKYWSGLGIAASILLGTFVIGKDLIINYFPKSAATYQLYGFETNIIGLEFVNINVRHQTQDGIEFLLVNGSIMNSSNSAKALPKVRGYLVDKDGNNIFNWPIDIAKLSLAAGEIVSFKSGMKDPATQAQKVKFQFIIDNKLAGK